MIRDDVKKILCDEKAESVARAGAAIRSDPEFRKLPDEVRTEFLQRCIAADEAYIESTEAAIEWLMDQKPAA